MLSGWGEGEETEVHRRVEGLELRVVGRAALEEHVFALGELGLAVYVRRRCEAWGQVGHKSFA